METVCGLDVKKAMLDHFVDRWLDVTFKAAAPRLRDAMFNVLTLDCAKSEYGIA